MSSRRSRPIGRYASPLTLAWTGFSAHLACHFTASALTQFMAAATYPSRLPPSAVRPSRRPWVIWCLLLLIPSLGWIGTSGSVLLSESTGLTGLSLKACCVVPRPMLARNSIFLDILWPPIKQCVGKLDKSSAVAEMGDRWATIGMGRKWGGAAVGAGSPLGPHLTQLHNLAWAETYLFTKWHLDPSNRLATNVEMPRSSA